MHVNSKQPNTATQLGLNTPLTDLPSLSAKPRPLWQRLTTGLLLASTLLVQTGQVLAQYNSAGAYIPGQPAPSSPANPYTGYAPNGQLYQGGQPVVENQAHIDARNVSNSTLYNVSAQGLSTPTASNPNFVHQTLSDIDAAAANPGGGTLGGAGSGGQVRSATVIYFTQPNNIYGAGSGSGTLGSPPVVPAGVNPATYQPLLNYNTYKDILANAPGAGYQSVVAPPNAPGTTPVPYVNGPYLIKAATGSDAAMAAMLFYKAPLASVFDLAQVNQTPTGQPSTIGGGVAVNLNQSQTQINHLSALSGGLVFASTAQLRNNSNNPNNGYSDPNSPNYNPNFNPNFNGSNNAAAQNAWNAFNEANALNNEANSLSFGNDLGYIGRQGQYVALTSGNNLNSSGADYAENGHSANSPQNRWAELKDLQAQAQKLDKREGYQQQANSLDLSGFAPNSLFGEGYNLFQYNPQLNPNGAAQNEYLKRLQSGQLQEGSADYMLAAQIAQDRYRLAFSERLETNKPLKYSVADAQRKANELKLNDINPNELFGQGFDLFKYNPSLRANGAAENDLLAKLQSGQLSAGSADYSEANQIAQQRLRDAYSQSLSPPEPKKVSKWKLIAGVVVGAVLTFVTAGAAAPFIASALTAVVGTAVAATSLVVTSIAGVIAGAVGAVASTTITTGSFKEGLKAGAKTLVSGSVKALVGAAIGFGFASLDLLGTAGTITGTISNIAVNTLSGAVSSTILGGGSFADNLKTAAISSVVTTVSANVAGVIGAALPNSDGTNVLNYAAHAVLGCAAAAAKKGDCAAGAIGAVAGEAAAATGFLDAAAQGTIGRTLTSNESTFFGGVVGGAVAAAVGSSGNVENNFATGQAAGSNAVENNNQGIALLLRGGIAACRLSPACVSQMGSLAIAGALGITGAKTINDLINDRAFEFMSNPAITQAEAYAMAIDEFQEKYKPSGKPIDPPRPSGTPPFPVTPDPLPNNTGNQNPVTTGGSNNTGGNQIVDPAGSNIVGGGYGSGGAPNVGNGIVMSNGYTIKPTDSSAPEWRSGVDQAFSQPGMPPKSEFTPTKWATDKDGKSFPVEWRHVSGAEVNIDVGHANNDAPSTPHIGWQTGGKRNSGGATRGHVFVPDVPVNRSPVK